MKPHLDQTQHIPMAVMELAFSADKLQNSSAECSEIRVC
jgi:hypothetical protein